MVQVKFGSWKNYLTKIQGSMTFSIYVSILPRGQISLMNGFSHKTHILNLWRCRPKADKMGERLPPKVRRLSLRHRWSRKTVEFCVRIPLASKKPSKKIFKNILKKSLVVETFSSYLFISKSISSTCFVVVLQDS